MPSFKETPAKANKFLRHLLNSTCLALALGWSLLPAVSLAQEVATETAEDEEESELRQDVVIVTVERREQNLQDFAGTAVSVTQDQLDALGVGFDFQSIQQIVPGLNISFNEGFSEIFLRGVGTQDNSSTSEQPTAVHYNGVYIPRSRGIGPLFFDLARIEVNVGPQGTLRGRNASAGSINIIPAKPELGEVEAKGSFGFGTFSLREIEGVLNLPIGDKLAIRGAYYSREHDDYFQNALQGLTFAPVDGAGSEDEEAFRFSVLYEPNERFSAHFVFDNLTQGGTGFPGNFQGQAQSQGFTPQNNPIDPFLQNFLTPGFVDNEIRSYVLTSTYDFGPVSLEFTGGYRAYSNLTVNQRRPFQFGTPNPTALPGVVANVLTFDPDNFNTNYISDDARALTLEGRIFSNQDQRFRWTAGVFYLNEDQDEFRWDTSDRQFFFNNLGGPDFFETDNVSFAVYGDATFDISDKFRLKGGLRYTDDEKRRTGFEVQFIFDPAAIIDFDGNGVTDANDLRFSTSGFVVRRAGDQELLDPETTAPEALFLNFVEQFGSRDTVDEIFALFPGTLQTTTTSDLGLFTQTVQDGYLDWRVGVEYDLMPDHLLYATISTGTRSAGINNPILVAGELINETFDTEDLLAFEIGSKNVFDFGGLAWRLNVAAFYYDFNNQVLQVAATADGGGFEEGAVNVNANLTVQNINAGSSRIFGLTVDGGVRLPFGFVFDYNAQYLNARFGEALISDGRQLAMDTNGDGTPDLAPPNVDVSGNRLLFSPTFSFTTTFGQDIELPFGDAFWRFTTSFRTSTFATPFNSEGFDINGDEIPLEDLPLCCFTDSPLLGDGSFFNDRVGAVALHNITWGVNVGPKRNYRIEGFVTNLTNVAYNQRQIINAFVNIGFINPPRVIGGRVSAVF